MKVLMVCLGNICRSPLAEGILQHKADKAGLGWQVESAGTGNWHTGEAPHRLSQKVARLNGIDICSQKARQYRKTDMLAYDLIVTMDADNYREVKRMSGELWDASKVEMLLNYVYPGENRSVPDPWYGGEKDFHEVFEMIGHACDRLVARYAAADGSTALHS